MEEEEEGDAEEEEEEEEFGKTTKERPLPHIVKYHGISFVCYFFVLLFSSNFSLIMGRLASKICQDRGVCPLLSILYYLLYRLICSTNTNKTTLAAISILMMISSRLFCIFTCFVRSLGEIMGMGQAGTTRYYLRAVD